MSGKSRASLSYKGITNLFSSFGMYFQEAAEKANARVRQDRFDASVMEIRKEDLLTFLDTLKHTI